MSVKIKINWDNENVVSESVRIYRADSAFTPTSLPPLLTEIIGDVYEYEDLTTVENRTYFYMLSATLGEQEVFTECFNVSAENNEILVNFTAKNLIKIFSLASSVIRARGLCKLSSGNYLALIFESGNKLIEVNESGTVIKTLNLGTGFDVYSCQFTDDGLSLHVFTATHTAAYRRYTLSAAYDINTAVQSFSQNSLFTDQIMHTGLIFASPRIAYAFPSSGGSLRKITLDADYDFASVTTNELLQDNVKFSNSPTLSLFFSKSGKTALMTFGGWQSSQNTIKTYTLSSAFDMKTATVKESVAVEKPAGAAYIYLCGGVIDKFSSKKEFYFGGYLRDFQKIILS